MSALRRHWPVLTLAIVLACLLTVTLRPYAGNVTALFHIDQSIADAYPLPHGTVVLTMPGYDGMEYYQFARNLPVLVNPARWSEVALLPPGPYASQRMLLPVLAYVVAFGQDMFLPYAFLLLNIGALLGTCALFARFANGSLRRRYALGLALCPAAMVGLHFSLAEPLSLFLTTAVLLRYQARGKVDALQTMLLALLVLSREINILFVVALGVYSLFRRDWRGALLLCIPAATFVAWHGMIWLQYHQLPFLWSTGKRTLPFAAIWELLSGQKGYNQYTLSSIALFLCVVLPAGLLTIVRLLRDRSLNVLPVLLLFFLAVMVTMPDHIWGSITSIGRVITPVYPLFFLYAAQHDKPADRLIAAAAAAIGLAGAAGLALIAHPYILL